ncbi:MAG: beta-ketoacyl-[acyl-carrier-protein] synthase family protein [bacterium]
MRRVVVTGLGAVTPIGTGVEAFAQALLEATPGIDQIASFDARSFPTRIAGEVTDLSLNAVELPAAEGAALRRDRKSLFGLVAAREALRQAFGDGAPTTFYAAERIAVRLAAGLEIFHLEDLVSHVGRGTIDVPALRAAMARLDVDSHLQIPAHLGARVIAREAGARGSVGINVSACAAGTQAVGEAWHLIRDGVADLVVTGGYDSMVNPLAVAGFSMLQALSRSNELGPGASRPFDRRRDGFVLGEGGGVCVLESYESAVRRGATLHGEILGYASNLDAYRVTDPPPDQRGTIAVMRAALASAGLGAADIDYINAHGTATLKNDPSETRAIREVFGEHAAHLPVSSTKSQIGHLIGAAGAVELVAALLAIRHDHAWATINLHDPDPECDLDYVPLTPRPAAVRTVLSNSFGFGGQNACIIVSRVR